MAENALHFNTYRNSLFSETVKQKTTNERGVIHRLVCVAKINQDWISERDKCSAVTEYFEEFLSKLQKKTPREVVTGLLLVYSKSIIHLLESTSEVLTQILKNLSEMEEGSNSLLKDCRILVVSHCLPVRLFSSWSCRMIKVPVRQTDAAEHTQPVELLVSHSLTMIYKYCTYLLKGIREGQDTKEQAHVLEEETIIHLCQSQVLHSPNTFLKSYTKPVNILMDTEIVWPTSHRLYWKREW
ncbi:hypothetical protein PGIGA_G00036250 [Pangasianodon gigas]|uniref:Uncharacterized protein n=1 Tax=Pangasianodon gigas TaxID=30993 RepID=A0ACC5WYW8_PANGG|nr:hypothetical protein [Pangasianodon gigas]